MVDMFKPLNKTLNFVITLVVFMVSYMCSLALARVFGLNEYLNIDNRMMYTVGAAARELNFLDSDIVIGIPLSATAKSPYFDR